MNRQSIKIRNYKCFNNDPQGFDDIKRVNVIIGKNNSGKSALVDMIESISNNFFYFAKPSWRSTRAPEVVFESFITQSIINNTFPQNTSGGRIMINHRSYGNQLLSRGIVWNKSNNTKEKRNIQVELESVDDNEITPSFNENGNEYEKKILRFLKSEIEEKIFVRVSAERDIRPEPVKTNLEIQSNGEGVTNVIQSFLNNSSLPSRVVEHDLLDALNQIFRNETQFTRILCQIHENNNWEIYLEEKGKGQFSLSDSGSGLKTIIIVLCNLILIPQTATKPLKDFVFGFEELENNLHPALFRMLNDYIYQNAVENDFQYFITTHSSVLIDQFSRKIDAQIIHVTSNESHALCNTVRTYIERSSIIQDLDVRASDLLQSNGIIWVEGPSDRIYLNRWIELWSSGALREGTDYQIVFYGGRLLSYLSAEDPDLVKDALSILNVNRNAILIMDSDKRSDSDSINDTKKRIVDEFERKGLLAWITEGREIENYIPLSAINKMFSRDVEIGVGQYESFFSYLDRLIEGEGSRLKGQKPFLASQISKYMNIKHLGKMLDLNEKMERLTQVIMEWTSRVEISD